MFNIGPYDRQEKKRGRVFLKKIHGGGNFCVWPYYVPLDTSEDLI